jgi:hypothetical protein
MLRLDFFGFITIVHHYAFHAEYSLCSTMRHALQDYFQNPVSYSAGYLADIRAHTSPNTSFPDSPGNHPERVRAP